MKYHIKRIAVATNFSAEADNALEYAIFLAKKYSAGLDIIHAVAPARIGKGQMVSAAYEKLKQYKAGILEQQGIEAKVYARMKEVTDFIYDYCVSNKTDLLIIGVQPHVKKYFGESKSYGIIMKVECPVLSIPPSFKKYDFGHVLFPVRDVSGVEEKLFYSKPFIDNNRSELHLINFGQQNPATIDELVEKAMREGIKVGILDYNGGTSPKDISSRIVTLAGEKDDDLIVINATKEKEWYRVFGENYTEYILKEADIAVLSITHAFESEDTVN